MEPTIEEQIKEAQAMLLAWAKVFNELQMKALIADPPEPNKMQGLQQISMLFANTYAQLNNLKKTYEPFFADRLEDSDATNG